MNSSKEPNPLAQPIGFARGILGIDPYDWQKRVIADVWMGGSVALRAANGSGKTVMVAAPLAIAHCAIFPRSLTVVTSGSWLQLEKQFFPAIHAHSEKMAGWEVNKTNIRAPNGSEIIGFATNEPGRAEGWHGKREFTSTAQGPLLYIVDEAKTVPDCIFEAMERCTRQRTLIMSSPGGMEGEFYRAFTSRAAFYHQHVVQASDCPHIDPKATAEKIAKWGLDHPLVRSMIFAEFSDSDSSYIVPLSKLDNCYLNPPVRFKDGRKRAFCDFAAGGDENVLAVMEGNLVRLVAWRDADTVRSVGRFIMEFRKAELNKGDIWGDEGGLGKPMCDSLRDAGWPLNRVNNGSAANDTAAFANRGSEIWMEGARMIEKCSVILPDDPELRGQLTSRQWHPNAKGKLQAESKDDMKKRGLPSPDRADAVLGVMVCGSGVVSKSLVGDVVGQGPAEGWMEHFTDWTPGEQDTVLPGANAGY